MNLQEHLLTILGEECAEIAQRASKAKRFGMHEVEPGQELTNHERLLGELYDLVGTVVRLRRAGILVTDWPEGRSDLVDAKVEKIGRMLEYSREQGTLT